MIAGGRDHRSHVDVADKLLEVCSKWATQFGSHFMGSIWVGIDDKGQLDMGQGGIFLGVESSQITSADDGGAQGGMFIFVH